MQLRPARLKAHAANSPRVQRVCLSELRTLEPETTYQATAVIATPSRCERLLTDLLTYLLNLGEGVVKRSMA